MLVGVVVGHGQTGPVLRRHGAGRIVLIVNRGHGLTMLAYPDEGPRVLAAVRSFIGDQARR
jgi:hypothetical protein